MANHHCHAASLYALKKKSKCGFSQFSKRWIFTWEMGKIDGWIRFLHKQYMLPVEQWVWNTACDILLAGAPDGFTFWGIFGKAMTSNLEVNAGLSLIKVHFSCFIYKLEIHNEHIEVAKDVSEGASMHWNYFHSEAEGPSAHSFITQ